MDAIGAGAASPPVRRRGAGVRAGLHRPRKRAGPLLLLRGGRTAVFGSPQWAVIDEADRGGVLGRAGNAAGAADRAEWRGTHLLGSQPAMKTRIKRPGLRPGYISYAVVISLGVVLLMMMAEAYRSALQSQDVQAGHPVAHRLPRQGGRGAARRSSTSCRTARCGRCSTTRTRAAERRAPMRWKTIFSDSLDLANARTRPTAETDRRRSISAR